MRNLLKHIILFLIDLLTPRSIYAETDFSHKILNEIDLSNSDIKILTDTGFKPVSKIFKIRDYEIWRLITVSGKVLEGADHHRVYTSDMQCLWLSDLKPGMVLLTEDGTDIVKSIEPTGFRSEMFDLTVNDDNHRFYANGILSHNTTTTAILFVWYLCFHTDKTAAIVANKDSIAAEVFGKVQNIFEHLPFFLKPGAYTFSSTTISLDNGCKAVYRTATIDTVQGFTIDMMFVDEFAYIKNTRAREFWVNAYPTMSSIPDSKVILCSTPNGRNLFWELWNGAITGKNMFIPFRVDYWQVPGRDDKWVAQEKANIGEEGFAQQYELSFDTKMKSILGKSTFQFLDKVQHDFERGMLPIGTDYDDKFRWATIFKYSLRKDWFLLSIDIGEGLLQDASVIKIKKLCKTGPESFVLVTIGVFESDDVQIPDFAQVLVQLTKRLNLDQVRIVIERNTYGDLFMLNIENIEEKDSEGFEIPLECYAKFARKEGAKLEKGLRLNSANKKFGVAAWKQYMNSLENIETDTGCINQVREFGEDEKGNFKAAIGHDDLVMPEVNLSYYIKSDNQGWREFKQSFLDDSEIDEYNSNVLKSLKLNAVTRIKEEIDASKYQITQVDDKFNEYSIITTPPKSEENIELFGAATKEERKKIIENSDDEYALAAKIYDKSKAKANKRIVDYRNEFRKTKTEDKIDYKDIVNMF